MQQISWIVCIHNLIAFAKAYFFSHFTLYYDVKMGLEERKRKMKCISAKVSILNIKFISLTRKWIFDLFIFQGSLWRQNGPWGNEKEDEIREIWFREEGEPTHKEGGESKKPFKADFIPLYILASENTQFLNERVS